MGLSESNKSVSACIGEREPGGGQWGSLSPQLWSRGGGAPQLFIGLGTVGTVVLPKLGVVGHKGKLNGRKHFSEKPPSFIGSIAHLTDKPLLLEDATKVLSSFS